MFFKSMIFGCVVMGCLSLAGAQDNFTNWPAGDSPQGVGKQLADHFVTSPHQYTKTIHYSEIAAWYGALRYAYLTHDDALRDELIKRFEPLMPGGTEAERLSWGQTASGGSVTRWSPLGFRGLVRRRWAG